MKQLLFLLIVFSMVVSCGPKNDSKDLEKNLSELEGYQYRSEEAKPSIEKISIRQINGQKAFLVNDLVNALKANYEYDDVHRSLKIEIDDHVYKFIYGIPVIEKSGVYLPGNDIEFILYEESVYLPLSFLEKVLGLTISLNEESVMFNWVQTSQIEGPIHVNTTSNVVLTVEEMIDYLSFLQKPIEGAKVSAIANHLPGAKRPYRNGYHEGIDWYPYASGQHISTQTPVYAMAEGIVVRADHNYREYTSPEVRNKELAYTAQLGETPKYIFDRLRGRQVWIQYGKGVMTRFAHLDSIPANIKVGDNVSSSTIIGYVGNSGTSGAVNNDGTQLHLHQDILIYGELFWKSFSLEEVKKIVTRIFSE